LAGGHLDLLLQLFIHLYHAHKGKSEARKALWPTSGGDMALFTQMVITQSR